MAPVRIAKICIRTTPQTPKADSDRINQRSLPSRPRHVSSTAKCAVIGLFVRRRGRARSARRRGWS